MNYLLLKKEGDAEREPRFRIIRSEQKAQVGSGGMQCMAAVALDLAEATY